MCRLHIILCNIEGVLIGFLGIFNNGYKMNKVVMMKKGIIFKWVLQFFSSCDITYLIYVIYEWAKTTYSFVENLLKIWNSIEYSWFNIYCTYIWTKIYSSTTKQQQKKFFLDLFFHYDRLWSSSKYLLGEATCFFGWIKDFIIENGEI